MSDPVTPAPANTPNPAPAPVTPPAPVAAAPAADPHAAAIAALNAKIEQLSTEVAKRTHESQMLTLKSEYPEVPLDLIPAELPFEKKMEYAAKLKAWGNPAKSQENPVDAWAKVGPAVPPASEAERVKLEQEAAVRREELVKSGDPARVASDILARNVGKVKAMFKLG